jgi:glutathione S-transferase
MQPLTLISATPSPFARMNRIALLLKSIPFTLRNEIPWESSTQTPQYNPLEKLPILLIPDGTTSPVYDSTQILEYIVRKYADRGPALMPGDVDLDLRVRQIVVLSQGCLDAFVLASFERRREAGKQSALWVQRQERKIDGAMRAFGEMVGERRKEGERWLVGGEMTIADIAVVCAVGQIDWSGMRKGWREEYPVLEEWWEGVDGRREFVETRPVMFDLKGPVL